MEPAIHIPLPDRWLDSRVSIAVVGAGGTGSQVVDQLASLNATMVALGHPGFDVTVFDPDTVSASNIGRQRFCSADIGRHKSDVLVHRVNLFHGLNWRSIADYFGDRRFFDLVVGCADTVSAREVMQDCSARYWLDCGNSARSGHVILGEPLGRYQNHADERFRLPTWMDLFPGVTEAPDAPSCSVEEAIRRQSWPVNHRAAQLACELLYCWFRHGRIDWHGCLFTVDPPSVSVLPVRADTWWPFGLEVCSERLAGLAEPQP